MATTMAVTLATTTMKDGSTKLQLRTPYTPDLPARCRALGGTWGASDKAWYFDPRDSEAVRALCVKTFGSDPLASDAPADLVTVRVTIDWRMANEPVLWLFGRELVSRSGRDYAVRLGRGVVIAKGTFPLRGGSMKHPAIQGEGAVLEVRDVPCALVTETDAIRIVEDAAPSPVPTAVDQAVALVANLKSAEKRAEAVRRIFAALPEDERAALVATLTA